MRKKNHKLTPLYLRISIIFLLFFVFFQNPSHGSDTPLAFQPGEKLTFELKWSFITAGEAVLEVMPIEKINGIDAYHFVMTVKTTGFVDKIYKVRDRIDAFADVAMMQSLYFKKHQREGRSNRDVVVEFDLKNNRVQYSDYGKTKPPIDILPGTFDPLSAFYFARVFDWNSKKIMERPVTDGKKLIMGKGKIIKQQKIKVPAGTFNTHLFEPNIENVGGVFEKSKDAKIEIWLSEDHRKIPVRLKSKVVVGSFTGELMSYEGLTEPAQYPK